MHFESRQVNRSLQKRARGRARARTHTHTHTHTHTYTLSTRTRTYSWTCSCIQAPVYRHERILYRYTFWLYIDSILARRLCVFVCARVCIQIFWPRQRAVDHQPIHVQLFIYIYHLNKVYIYIYILIYLPPQRAVDHQPDPRHSF